MQRCNLHFSPLIALTPRRAFSSHTNKVRFLLTVSRLLNNSQFFFVEHTKASNFAEALLMNSAWIHSRLWLKHSCNVFYDIVHLSVTPAWNEDTESLYCAWISSVIFYDQSLRVSCLNEMFTFQMEFEMQSNQLCKHADSCSVRLNKLPETPAQRFAGYECAWLQEQQGNTQQLYIYVQTR